MYEKLVRSFFFFCLILIIPAYIFCQKYVGGFSGSLLTLNPAPSSAARGGSIIPFNNEYLSAFLTPAYFTFVDKWGVSITHSSLFFDISLNGIGFIFPFKNRKYGSIGGGILYVSSGETKEVSFGKIRNTTLKYSSFLLTVGYAKKFLYNKLSLGINLKYLSDTVGTETGHAFAFDSGLIFNTSFAKFYKGIEKNFQFYLGVRNLGTKIKYAEESEYLPLQGFTGISYKPFSFLNLTSDARYYLRYGIKDSLHLSFGAGLILFGGFLLPSAGYTVTPSTSYFTFGTGIMAGGKNKFKFDFAAGLSSEIGNKYLFSLSYFPSPSKIIFKSERVNTIRYLLEFPSFIEKSGVREVYLKNSQLKVKFLPLKINGNVDNEIVTGIKEKLIPALKKIKNIIIENNSPDIIIELILSRVNSKNLLQIKLSSPFEKEKIKILKVKFSSASLIKKLVEKIPPKLENEYLPFYFQTLVVKSTPAGAKVFIDNKPAGKTPVIIKNLSSGSYNVLLTKPGFKPEKEKVLIKGKPVELNIKLTPAVIKSIYNIAVKPQKPVKEDLIKAFDELLKAYISEKKDIMKLSSVSPDYIVNYNYNKFKGKLNLKISILKMGNKVFTTNVKEISENDIIPLTRRVYNFIVNDIEEMLESVKSKVRLNVITEKELIVKLDNEVIEEIPAELSIKPGKHHITIYDKERKLYDLWTKIEPEMDYNLAFLYKYKDEFTKLIPERFWSGRNGTEKDIYASDGKLYIKASRNYKLTGIKSCGLEITPFISEVSILQKKLKSGEFYFGIVNEKNEGYFIKVSKEGYAIVPNKDGEIPVNVLLPLGDEDSVYHTLSLKWNGLKFIAFIDDIKLGEIEENFSGEKIYFVMFLKRGIKTDSEVVIDYFNAFKWIERLWAY